MRRRTLAIVTAMTAMALQAVAVLASGSPGARAEAPARPEPDTSEGFPIPKGATLFAETQSSVSYLTSLDARAVLGFYRAQLAGRFALEEIPNGLSTRSETAPFAYVTVSNWGDQVLVTLTRNALVPRAVGRDPKDAFGVPLPAAATFFTRSADMYVVVTREAVGPLCEAYTRQLGAVDVALPPTSDAPRVVRSADVAPTAAYPYCIFTRTPPVRGSWSSVSLTVDRNGPGRVLFVVTRLP